MKIEQKSFVKPEPESRDPFLSKWMGITFGELVPHQGGTRFPFSTPPLYYAGTKINSDPEPCQGLDKALIKMTEYEVAVS